MGCWAERADGAGHTRPAYRRAKIRQKPRHEVEVARLLVRRNRILKGGVRRSGRGSGTTADTRLEITLRSNESIYVLLRISRLNCIKLRENLWIRGVLTGFSPSFGESRGRPRGPAPGDGHVRENSDALCGDRSARPCPARGDAFCPLPGGIVICRLGRDLLTLRIEVRAPVG